MKRKRFYNNKKRNQKWTEPEQGRKIEFADKYVEGGEADKFNPNRTSSKSYNAKSAKKNETRLKRFIIFVSCVLIISVGYTAMDVYVVRHAEPAQNAIEDVSNNEGTLSQMDMNFYARLTDGISLDASVMLSSVINEAQSNGFGSLAFEAKRADGTIGYDSKLASVETFNVESSFGAKPEQSIKQMLANDIMPIAVISCYKDNTLPVQAQGAAITKGKKLYTDEDGNTYLNPDSDFAYNYIKDIISELVTYGVNVFVLKDTALPEDISKDYNDGFKEISKKLYNDLDANIKFLNPVEVSVTKREPVKKQITKMKTDNKVTKNDVYVISSKISDKKLRSELVKNGVNSFIITK